MFVNSKARNIKFQSDVCDCTCTVFRNGKQNSRYATHNTEQDIMENNTQSNESSTTFNPKKKISLADMNKKKKVMRESIQIDKQDESTKEVKKLLSESTLSSKVENGMKKIESVVTATSVPSELRLSLQDFYRPRVLNPEGNQPHRMMKREPLSQVYKHPAESSNRYNEPVRLKVPMIYPCSFQNSQRSGEITFAQSSLTHSLDLQNHRELKQAIIDRRTVENISRPTRQINAQNEQSQQSTVHVKEMTENRQIETILNSNSPENRTIVNTHPRSQRVVVPKETESRYEGTIHKADLDKSSKGHVSGTAGQLRFKNIVSMPGSDYLGEEPDSIIVDQFTPAPGTNIIVPNIQNRFSQPPMLSHDEMEFLRNLTGKEVSAFQLNNNLEFSAKTQR